MGTKRPLLNTLWNDAHDLKYLICKYATTRTLQVGQLLPTASTSVARLFYLTLFKKSPPFAPTIAGIPIQRPHHKGIPGNCQI
jgi:hypothetical protein